MNDRGIKIDLFNNRITGLDVYRIIACMLVVINHCNSKVMYQVTPKSLAWYVTVGTFYVTKVAVPGFFMIAGYNLLHREDDWKRSLKRAFRIFMALIIFSVLYFAWKLFRGSMVLDAPAGMSYFFACIKTMVAMIVTGPITDAYWYLYTYLGLMLVLPLLQRLVSRMKDEDYKAFLLLAVIFVCVWPTIAQFVPELRLARDFELPIVCTSVVYMIIGHYYYITNGFMDELFGGIRSISSKKIRDFISDSKGIRTWILMCVIALGFILNMIISVAEFNATAGESFLSVGEIQYLPLAMESVSLFALLLRADYPVWIERLVAVIAPTTFGIYLLTDMLCAETNLMYFYLCPHMNRLLAVAIEDIAVLVIGFLVVWLLRLIPVVRKLL